nr:hypothetical protein [Tanacetum cinerariifolium]
PDVPSDDSKEELSWKSSDDEEVGSHEEGKESDDDNSEKESDDEEEQESRLSEEVRIQEEDAKELYRDVNINQGRGLQVTQNVEDT